MSIGCFSLRLIRDQIATTVTVEPEDFEFAPFLGAPRLHEGGLLGLRNLGEGGGKLSRRSRAKAEAHQPVLRSFSEVGLFGDQLTKLLDELNTTLAA